MERGRTFRELVQEEKKKLMKEEILESAFYKETLLSVAGELTGGTLKKVELVKLPESGWAGRCNDQRVLLNIENSITASFPSVPLKSDSITGILGHECGHWNFSDFNLRKKYLEGFVRGEWYLHPPEPKTLDEAKHLEEMNGYLEQKHKIAIALLAETASFIQNMLDFEFSAFLPEMQEGNQNQCSTAKNDVKQRARRIMRRACFLWYGDAGSLSCYVSDSISMAPFALSTDKTDSMIGIRAADSCSLHSSIINRSWRIAGLSLFISGLKIYLESSLSARTKGYRTSILGFPL